MYYPALIVFVLTLIPLLFTKFLFVAEWDRPKDENGIDARVVIFGVMYLVWCCQSGL